MAARKLYPSPARLIEIANAADKLASSLRKYWPLRDVTLKQNPARLRFPKSPDEKDPEFIKRMTSLSNNVAAAWVELVNSMAGVSPADWLEGVELPDDVRKQCPKRLRRSATTAVGWSYDVTVALSGLRELLPFVLNAIGCGSGKIGPITHEDVLKIEDAAGMLRAEVEEERHLPKGKKRGPYKTDYDPKADKKLSDDWKAAKKSGTRTIADFAKDRGFGEDEVREAIDRHRKK